MKNKANLEGTYEAHLKSCDDEIAMIKEQLEISLQKRNVILQQLLEVRLRNEMPLWVQWLLDLSKSGE